MKSTPLLIPCLGFTMGIVAFQKPDVLFYSGIGLMLVSLGLFFTKMRYLIFVLIFGTCCLVGYGRTFVQENIIKLSRSSLQNFSKIPSPYLVQESRQAQQYTRWTVKHLKSGLGGWIYSKDRRCTIMAGDTLILEGIDSLMPPLNPQEFDFKKYAVHQGIHFQKWMDTCPEHLESRGSFAHSIAVMAQHTEKKLEEVFQIPLTQALLKGVLLGLKNQIPSNIQDVFVESGTLHIMAVSGMHVGVVAGLLAWIFRGWNVSWWKWLGFIVTLVGIWAFVLITGCHASAVRAGVMFSLFKFGWTLHRMGNGLNTLCFGVILMLLWAPYQLYQIGFQFSVVAVASILLFMPLMTWQIEHRPSYYLLNLVSLSCAVQIGLAPLSMHYFHQFPTYFFATNLLAIPGVGVMVILGIFNVALGFLHLPLAHITSAILDGWCSFLHAGLKWMNSWPAHLIEHIWIDQRTLLFYYIAILLSYALLKNKKFRFLIPAGVLICTVITTHYIQRWQDKLTNELVLYSGRFDGEMDLYMDGHCFSWSEGKNQPDYRSFRHPLKGTTFLNLQDTLTLERHDQMICVTQEKMIINHDTILLKKERFDKAIQIQIPYE